jgi:protein subunit release factor A
MIYDDEYFNSKQFQVDIEMSCFNRNGETEIKGGRHTGFHFDGIRLKHIPTGIITESVEERTQFKNRDKAMNLLKEKLRWTE